MDDRTSANAGGAERFSDHLPDFLKQLQGLSPKPATDSLPEPKAEELELKTLTAPSESSLAEANCLRLPFAVLWDKDTGRKQPLVIQHTLWNESRQAGQEISWEVQPSAELGMPGPLDRRVWRALESIVEGKR